MADSPPPNEKEVAFFAMIEYLDQHWRRGKSEEIGGMLGDLHFGADGTTMDPACWSDWEEAFNKAQGKTKADYNSKLS